MTDLAQLRIDVRQASDMEEHTTFITESEVDRYINLEIAKLYDLLIKADFHEWHLFTLPVTVTQIAGAALGTLPASFGRMRKVFLHSGSRKIPLRPGKLEELYSEGSHPVPWSSPRYRIIDDGDGGSGDKNILLFPAQDATLTIWYYSTPPTMSDPADPFPFPEEFIDYVILGAAIRCLRKEQTDFTGLLDAKLRVEHEIMISAKMLDSSEPDTVTDVESDIYLDGLLGY